MPPYERFAEVYACGPYPAFSQRIAEAYPDIAARYSLPTSGRLLDIACGEGSFVIAMAQQGWQVDGVDRSASMLRLASDHAQRASVTAVFHQADMTALDLPPQYNLITCWFDSLNYLENIQSITAALRGIQRALKPGGYFLFDMNTLYGLSVNWLRQACFLQQDTPDLVEIHSPTYDYERQAVTDHITMFVRQGNAWERNDEEHCEYGYSLTQIRSGLSQAGLEEIACLGSLRDNTPLQPNSGRAWFVTRKA